MENRDFSVVIPFQYNGSKWDNNEIRHTLRSIDKNFDFDFDVTIYSDKPIGFLKNVSVINIPRYYPARALKTFAGTKHYENYYDTLNKLKSVAYNDDLCEDVLYLSDDILLLKKQDKDSIKTIYAGGTYESKKHYWDNPRTKWARTIQQAIRKVRGYDKVFLYETHLPRYYQRSKLKEMFKMFPIENMDIPYAPSTVYFNFFYNQPDYCYKDESVDVQIDNPVKAGFYGSPNFLCDSFPSRTKEQVDKFTKDKLWVNYNDAGLQEPLKEWIHKQFPKKCKFEK